MDNETLTQRQRWFRSFPEGTLEFLLVTRILAIFLLLALAVAREIQRPLVLVAMAALLLADYMLTIWWAVQTAADVDVFFEHPGQAVGPRELRRRRLLAALPACLPAIVAAVVLAPWPKLVIADPVARAALTRVLLPAGEVAFIVMLVVAHWALRRVPLGPVVWTLLLLVPFIHWFAVHRLVNNLRERLGRCQQAGGGPVVEGSGLAVPLADATWVLAVLPWVALLVVGLPRGPGLTWQYVLPPCSAVLTAAFAVADVAAMEGLQRQLMAALRSLGTSSRP